VAAQPVIGLTPATLTFTAVQGTDPAAPQQFTVTNTGGGTLNWTASDDAPWFSIGPAAGSLAGAASEAVTVTVTSSGLAVDSYSGTVTVTDASAGNSPQTVTVNLTVTAIPNVDPVADFTSSCADLECIFTDASTDSDGTITAWSWNFGDGNTSTAQNPTQTYTEAGPHFVSLTVTDDLGAEETVSRWTRTVDISVVSCTWLDCTFSGSSTATGSEFTITDWNWDFGDGGTATGQTPTYGFPSGGTYTVTATVTLDDGTTDAARLDVTPNQQPVAGFQVVCRRGDDCEFRDRSTDDGPVQGWLWSIVRSADSSVVPLQGPADASILSHQFGEIGIFEVTLTVDDDKGEGTSDPTTQLVTCEARGNRIQCS